MLSHAFDACAPQNDAFDFAALRRREFARLDAQRHCYLDYTGSALYGASQLHAHLRLLESGLYGNPHAESATARASTAAVERARRDVLRFLDVDESTHVVVFTANASAAIKLVAESYAFGANRALVLSADNHNSVNGVREYARRAGAATHVLPLTESLELDDPLERLCAIRGSGLLAYPAQSNFSGVRHPLGLVRQARERGFDVLLDVAACVPSHALSLRDVPADFAALSFYKLFGYPTGLGAMVMRREAMRRLRRPWFAGGTVRYASVIADTHRLHGGAEGYEDGTPDFLGIAALPAGFALLEEIGMARIERRVAALAATLYAALATLRHANGSPRVRPYGPRTMASRGGTIVFNLFDADGGVIDYASVEHAARDAGISVRGGCFCNPGASERAFGAEAGRHARCLAALGDGFTPQALAACSGGATGAIRASVGIANDERDVARFVEFIAGYSTSRQR